MAESASGRQRPWAAALCFGCCRGDDEPRRGREHKLRTVPAPVDGSAEDDQGVRRGEDAGGKVSLLLRTFCCCFLPPARTLPSKGSSAQQKRRLQERVPGQSQGSRNGDDDPPDEAPPARRADHRIVDPTTVAEIGVAAATIIPRDADTSGSSDEFGPAAGLCVLAAASTVGLLGGRLLAVVTCVCAWFLALWIRRRRRLVAGTRSK